VVEYEVWKEDTIRNSQLLLIAQQQQFEIIDDEKSQ
jgi:hypothetical protein